MAAPLYRISNGASPAAAAGVKVTTSGAVKTMLQVLHPNNAIRVVEWGISFDGSTAGVPIACELIHTTTVAATVTAAVANDMTLLTDPGGNVPGVTYGTAATGYTASAEGTVVAPVRIGDYQLVAPTNQYLKQFPMDQEFVVPAAGILRIRVTAAVAVNAVCYVTFAVG